MISFTAAIVSAFVVGIKTPFPAASPDAFTTCLSFSPNDSTYLIASSVSVNVLYFAVGIPCSCRKSLVNALLASNSAAACDGPKQSTSGHLTFISSTSPATRGASGPTTTMRAPTSFVSSMTVSLFWFAPRFSIFLFSSAAVPPFPGQHNTLATSGDCAKATASACSLPPEPTTITTSFWPDEATTLSAVFLSSSARLCKVPAASAAFFSLSPDTADKTSLTEPPTKESVDKLNAATTVESSPERILDRTDSASEQNLMYSVSVVGSEYTNSDFVAIFPSTLPPFDRNVL
mmetsp:Transcript_34103/g.82714  ORF Transcript_34103/g.82714 Transcript_34103/m.82714 type:complete len:290 (-) Transcript_34103:185-1054(-)